MDPDATQPDPAALPRRPDPDATLGGDSTASLEPTDMLAASEAAAPGPQHPAREHAPGGRRAVLTLAATVMGAGFLIGTVVALVTMSGDGRVPTKPAAEQNSAVPVSAAPGPSTPSSSSTTSTSLAGSAGAPAVAVEQTPVTAAPQPPQTTMPTFPTTTSPPAP